MDPDEALSKGRAAVAKIDCLDASEAVDYYIETRGAATDEVLEAFRNLDDWIRLGGFPPRAWLKAFTSAEVKAVQQGVRQNAEAATRAIEEMARDHADLMTLTAYMADNDYSVADIAYAVEKPWKFADELLAAQTELNKQVKP